MPDTLQNGVAAATQPVVYGVGAVTVLGVTVQDWVLIGTGLLVIINLTIGAIKLHTMWKEKRNGRT